MGIKIDRFALGPLETNAFVITNDSHEALVIDPPPQSREIVDFLLQKKLKPSAIVLTHAHFDHIMGIPEIHRAFEGVPVYVHPKEKILLQNSDYNASSMIGIPFEFSGDTQDLAEGAIQIDGFSFTVFEVYGHSPGGCAFLFENQCIVGDTLFAGSVGRSDFPGCDGPALLKNISEKILTLPDETLIYPGHGGSTTVGREKRSNPFFRR